MVRASKRPDGFFECCASPSTLKRFHPQTPIASVHSNHPWAMCIRTRTITKTIRAKTVKETPSIARERREKSLEGGNCVISGTMNTIATTRTDNGWMRAVDRVCQERSEASVIQVTLSSKRLEGDVSR